MNAIFVFILVGLFMFLTATGKWNKILDVVRNNPA